MKLIASIISNKIILYFWYGDFNICLIHSNAIKKLFYFSVLLSYK